MEENGGAFDDWRAMVSSPKGLAQSFVSEEEFASETKPIMSEEALEKVNNDNNGDKRFDEEVVASVSNNNVCCPVETSSEWRSPVGFRNGGGGGGGGSIAERRAATCGFNAVGFSAPRINTARFRSTSPLSSPTARSPYITIPAGISPTALFDSPIMLPNSQAEASPTTGTFQLPTPNHESLMLDSVTPAVDADRGRDDGSSFRFQPHGSPVSLTCISGLESKSCHDGTSGEQMPQHVETFHGEDAGIHHLLEGDQKGTYPTMGAARTSEDGYNWRKYGQKQVKGSEYPRSYYKCTHPDCQVKKKVERSHDGQITEIIYKGAHSHPEPQPNRRSTLGYSFSYNEKMSEETSEASGSCVKGGAVWRNIQPGCKDIVGSDWSADGLERTSSTSVVTEISNPLMSTTQGKSLGVLFESVGTPELLSTLASHDDDDDEDGATHGSISLTNDADADDDESESKRRKKDSSLIETNLASRSVREPRVVVQVESEVDILEDGYRWRKYGQKVVKGNPNPRSYYKCTSAGCSVRKHVERACHSLKSVITTYEGKHNHEVPAAKNNAHMNSGGGTLSPAVSSTQPTLTFPKNANAPKPEAHIQDLAIRFERNPDLGNEFTRSSFLGNFGSGVKFGASSIYQMKFPFLQNSVPYGSFVVNPTHSGMQAASSSAPVVPDFPMSFPLTIRRSASMGPGGFSCTNNHGKPISPVRSFLGGQQQQLLRESDTMFIKPKQEQTDESCLYDTRLPIVDHANASSSSVYCRFMGSFPS